MSENQLIECNMIEVSEKTLMKAHVVTASIG